MHARNKYAEKAPDFGLLSGLYPEFKKYVTYGANQRPRIDWTDFNATRELTRSLLHHDYGISWWIPDGQLCPAVTNRANYIHWIEDLLALAPAPWHCSGAYQVAGVDIGTGANCIYPLLGASLRGWRFVGTDITSVALEWAKWNVESNPHVSALIEVRNAVLDGDTKSISARDVLEPALPPSKHESIVEQEPQGSESAGKESVTESRDVDSQGPSEAFTDEIERTAECRSGVVPFEPTVPSTVCNEPGYCSESPSSGERSLGVLVGVVNEEERFDFCMCNPPFFSSMEEAGLNPRTACGGTEAEMVCPGGEEAFVAHIIEDSARLKHAIHWFTTMVGRKATLKGLTAKLWALGAAAVQTTEFVQGRTSRWGLAWSFTPPPKAAKRKNSVSTKSNHSFMLEGLGRGCTAVDVLHGLESQLHALGAVCTVTLSDFSISGVLPDKSDSFEVHYGDALGKRKRGSTGESSSEVFVSSNHGAIIDSSRSFKAWVFQQAPGSLLVKASLSKGSEQGATFGDLFEEVEQSLKQRFLSRSLS